MSEFHWIDHLRANLSNSFLCEESVPIDAVIDRPNAASGFRFYTRMSLLDKSEDSDHSSIWCRANLFYVAAKLLDRHMLFQNPGIFADQIEKLSKIPGYWSWLAQLPIVSPYLIHDEIQKQRLWELAMLNPPGRERVATTNALIAIELGLKAIVGCASLRDNGEFRFPNTHDFDILLGHVPTDLRSELDKCARQFSSEYTEFAEIVRSRVRESPPVFDSHRDALEAIRSAVGSQYSVFMDSTEHVGATSKPNWFEVAIDALDNVVSSRYAVGTITVDQPIYAMAVSRFLFEYLCPIAPPKQMVL
ncbi:MAG: hypothetical protein F4Y67_01010 [Chloroflexi bacterium]|nr:hypothetical protein [Chloroflexota bacterium]